MACEQPDWSERLLLYTVNIESVLLTVTVDAGIKTGALNNGPLDNE
jgi:hypothetical protein